MKILGKPQNLRACLPVCLQHAQAPGRITHDQSFGACSRARGATNLCAYFLHERPAIRQAKRPEQFLKRRAPGCAYQFCPCFLCSGLLGTSPTNFSASHCFCVPFFSASAGLRAFVLLVVPSPPIPIARRIAGPRLVFVFLFPAPGESPGVTSFLCSFFQRARAPLTRLAWALACCWWPPAKARRIAGRS